MNMTEIKRLIIFLRTKGWSGDEIDDFILYIGSGEAQYLPDENKIS